MFDVTAPALDETSEATAVLPALASKILSSTAVAVTSVKSVEASVILALPLKLTPAIVLAVASVVAVAARPTAMFAEPVSYTHLTLPTTAIV